MDNHHAVKIIDFNPSENKYELCPNVLKNIIAGNNLDKNCEIAIVSIAGAFRKGKSFILNFFLKYLKEVVSIQHKTVKIASHDLVTNCFFI